MKGGTQRFLTLLTSLCCATLISLAIAYQLWSIAHNEEANSDFRCVWLAGRLLLAGMDPYGPMYRMMSEQLFPGQLIMPGWFYPPHFSIVAVLAGGMPLVVGYWIAVLVSVIAIICSIAMTLSAARIGGIQADWKATTLTGAYVLTMSGTTLAIRITQPSVMAILGAAFVMRGVAAKSSIQIIIGLTLLTTKPQLALPIVVSLLFSSRFRQRLVASGGVILLLSVPAILIAGGLVSAAAGFLHNTLNGYGATFLNGPAMMLGLPHALKRFGDSDLSNLAAMAIATGVTGLLCAVDFVRKSRTEKSRLHAAFLISTSATIGVGALHSYDLILIILALPFMPTMTPAFRVIAWLALALLWRPENLARVMQTSLNSFDLATIGGQLLLIAMILNVVHGFLNEAKLHQGLIRRSTY